jgi:hypothetical protein
MASALFDSEHLFYCNCCNNYFRNDSSVSSSLQNYNFISFHLRRVQNALYAFRDVWKKF